MVSSLRPRRFFGGGPSIGGGVGWRRAHVGWCGGVAGVQAQTETVWRSMLYAVEMVERKLTGSSPLSVLDHCNTSEWGLRKREVRRTENSSVF
jgi:hypothetical protein